MYSRNSRKRPPEMHRLSGCLREVVAYKNRTIVHLYFVEDNLMHAMSKLRHVLFRVVT